MDDKNLPAVQQLSESDLNQSAIRKAKKGFAYVSFPVPAFVRPKQNAPPKSSPLSAVSHAPCISKDVQLNAILMKRLNTVTTARSAEAPPPCPQNHAHAEKIMRLENSAEFWKQNAEKLEEQVQTLIGTISVEKQGGVG